MREMPYDIEAEAAVLGGLILRNDAFDEVSQIVKPEDFFRIDHQTLMGEMLAMWNERKPCDLVTLQSHLQSKNMLEQCGGQAYVLGLGMDTPAASNVAHYAKIVREQAMRRSLVAVGGEIAELGFESGGRKSSDLVEQAEQSLFALRNKTVSASGPITFSDCIGRANNLFRERSDSSGMTGVASGLVDLDRMTNGFQKQNLIILAGRPSMGKSALAEGFALESGMRNGTRTLVFSMEMSAEEWATRAVSALGRIPMQNLNSGKLTDEELDRKSYAEADAIRASILVDETPALSPMDLRARSRRVAANGGLGLIIVDYIQLMSIPGFRENRTNEVSSISRSLKALAKELNVPVIALSQLNRSVEQRDNKRPRMSDLRESGGIEQDADVIIFVYRDEVYNPNGGYEGTAELLIEKQRNGPTGMRRVAFTGEFCRFENLSHEWEPPVAQERPRSRGFGRTNVVGHPSWKDRADVQ